MEKQRWEESEKRRAEERRSEKRKSQKKEDAGAREVRKVAKHCVFQMICGSGGSKSRLAKAAGAVVARSTFGSQNAQSTPFSDHFWKLHVEKVDAVVARSTFPSQNVQNTHHARSTFESWDVEKVQAVVARSTFRSQTCKKLTGSEHFRTFSCRFAWQAQGVLHVVKSEQKCEGFVARSTTTTTKLHYITLHSTTLHYNYSCTTPHYIQQLWVRWPTRWPLQPL